MATFDFDQMITVLESNDSEPESGTVASKTKSNKVLSTLIKYKSTASLTTTNPSYTANNWILLRNLSLNIVVKLIKLNWISKITCSSEMHRFGVSPLFISTSLCTNSLSDTRADVPLSSKQAC